MALTTTRLGERRMLGGREGQLRREARRMRRAGGNPQEILNMLAEERLSRGSNIRSADDEIERERLLRTRAEGVLAEQRAARGIDVGGTPDEMGESSAGGMAATEARRREESALAGNFGRGAQLRAEARAARAAPLSGLQEDTTATMDEPPVPASPLADLEGELDSFTPPEAPAAPRVGPTTPRTPPGASPPMGRPSVAGVSPMETPLPSAVPPSPTTRPQVAEAGEPAPETFGGAISSDIRTAARTARRAAGGAASAVERATGAVESGIAATQRAAGNVAAAAVTAPMEIGTRMVPGQTGRMLRDLQIPSRVRAGVRAAGATGAAATRAPLGALRTGQQAVRQALLEEPQPRRATQAASRVAQRGMPRIPGFPS